MKIKDIFNFKKSKKNESKLSKEEVINWIKNDIKNLREKAKKSVWEETDKSDFVFIMNKKLIDHSSEIEKFTESEKVFYLCNGFDNEVQSCGGFYSVYILDIGAYAYELPNYFRILGLNKIAEIIEKINQLYDKKLPIDHDEREEYIDSVYESIAEKMDEYYDEYSKLANNIYLVLYDYAIKNKDNFKIID